MITLNLTALMIVTLWITAFSITSNNTHQNDAQRENSQNNDIYYTQHDNLSIMILNITTFITMTLSMKTLRIMIFTTFSMTTSAS